MNTVRMLRAMKIKASKYYNPLETMILVMNYKLTRIISLTIMLDIQVIIIYCDS